MLPLCPDCDSEIEIDELDVSAGEIISCPECGVDLQVVALSPIELQPAPDSEAGQWGDN